MTDYYYLAVSLPPLTLGKEPEISREEFDQLIKTHLSQTDFKGKETKFIQFEEELTLILAYLRAKKLNKEFRGPLPQENSFYEEVKSIYEAYSSDPLQIYEALQGLRFRKIEEIIGLQVFTLERILGYRAQLRLLQPLDQDKGKEILHSMVAI